MILGGCSAPDLPYAASFFSCPSLLTGSAMTLVCAMDGIRGGMVQQDACPWTIFRFLFLFIAGIRFLGICVFLLTLLVDVCDAKPVVVFSTPVDTYGRGSTSLSFCVGNS
ncbi:hypothetical protein KPH14_011860 [Odynerus spinipes]|uniref:Uncharacterized protein n=1 Tax=Odynerus spinipes TaxID=1348599 RepID=A0AAD9RED6_9HYME|nr:hypothetical protein KPH14_011860 [Odynerus spinipes]